MSFLLKESTELTKKPVHIAVVEMVEEPSAAAKEKAVTIPIGIEELVAIPELASFDVADMLGTEDKPALGVTEAFIPDDWFQPPSFNFKETSQVQDDIDYNSEKTPAKTPGAKSDEPTSLEKAREGQEYNDLFNVHIPEDDFLKKYMDPETSTDGAGLPPGVSPVTVETVAGTGTEKSVEPVPPPSAPAPPKQLRNFDSRTQIPRSTIKGWQEGNLSLRPFIPIPHTEEELRTKQDQKLSAGDLMFMMEPMRKRKFDYAEGRSTWETGMDDKVDKDEVLLTFLMFAVSCCGELTQSNNNQVHRSIVGQVVGNALIKIAQQHSSVCLFYIHRNGR